MTPENTSARDPLLHLLGSMGGGGMAGYVTEMEAAGQRQLVHSDTLPVDAPWDALEVLGFSAGDLVPGDPLFRRCTLPDGWTREGSDHAMWSYVLDERGIRRVSVFYKAAFYDRRAGASVPNVGISLGNAAIYGGDAPALPEQWDVLTGEERADFRRALADYLARAEECPEVYGDRVPRVHQLVEASR